MNDTPEPATRLVNMNHLGRALLEYTDPPVEMLFVYNCNPLATMPDQNRVLEGLKREDLFTVVFEQVFTDTARYADVVLPATTFLENYDIAKALRPDQPAARAAGDRAVRRGAHRTREVFSELASGSASGEAEDETDTLLRIAGRMPPHVSARADGAGVATPPFDGAPIQFVDVFPLTADRKVDLFPEALAGDAPAGLYGYPAGSGDRAVSARADLPGEREDDLLDARRAARARGGAADAPRRRGRRAASQPTTRCASSTISARCSVRSP